MPADTIAAATAARCAPCATDSPPFSHIKQQAPMSFHIEVCFFSFWPMPLPDRWVDTWRAASSGGHPFSHGGLSFREVVILSASEESILGLSQSLWSRKELWPMECGMCAEMRRTSRQKAARKGDLHYFWGGDSFLGQCQVSTI